MHRVLVLYLPPRDPQASREYFENTRIPLAAKLPGQRTMRYSFEVAAAERGVTVLRCDGNRIRRCRGFGCSYGVARGQAVMADIPNYATGGAVVLNYPVQEAR